MSELLRKFLETAGPLIVFALVVLLALSEWQNNVLQKEIAAMKEAAYQEEIKHAKQLSTATDTIVAASREYDAVRAERDVLSDKLRKQVGSRAAGDSPGACVARVADLERMVADLHGLVERCDNGWHGCASRKDALTEIVKP
jgi:hypothetical protein